MNKKINWEDSGLLKGLELSHKQNLTDFFNQVAEVFDKTYYKNESTGTLLYPCIRKIYSIISLEDDAYNNIKIEDLDISSIITELDRLVPIIILMEQNFFKNYDIEAELLVIFCYNYVGGLSKINSNSK